MKNTIVWVLCAAVGLLLIGCGDSDDDNTTPSVWHEVFTVDPGEGLGGLGVRTDFDFSSPGRGWAVAGDKVLRYQNNAWSIAKDFGNVIPGWYFYFQSISAGNAGTVWICGNRRNYQTDDVESALYRFNGTSWQPVAGPPEDLGEISCVEFVDDHNVWIGGWFGIYHYDGAAWTKQSDEMVLDFSFVDAQTGWAITLETAYGDILRWNGSAWTSENAHSLIEGSVFFDVVKATRADDAWVVGSDAASLRGVILHYDGAHWKLLSNSPTPALIAGDFLGPREGWVAGEYQRTTWYYDQWGFDQYDMPAGYENGGIYRIYAVAPDDVWMMAERVYASGYSILHFTGF